ncbi:hypothetical protein WSM22_06430 [Cytophagales bacterium WSM2-2]|nr:hypothetical protein WSM22_06430 [Cytophagales bacterium WSM2-2]
MNANKLAIIVSYYLARFDKEAVSNLGYKSINEAFEETALKLGVNKIYIKLRRDEFDPAFPWRIGWQRPMAKRIIKTIEAFQELNESDVREIVLNILNNKDYRDSEEINNIITLTQETQNKGKLSPGKFILRGPTGKQAEEYFIEYYKTYQKPEQGILRDTRDLGCGYDFEIQNGSQRFFVEIKGLSEISGGVLFTNKEWSVALTSGNSYYLVIVKNLKNKPKIVFIQNPTFKLKAKKIIYTSVQIQWAISDNLINSIQ